MLNADESKTSGHLLSWPRLLAPVRCLGVGRTARIEVPNSDSVGTHPPTWGALGSGLEIEVSDEETFTEWFLVSSSSSEDRLKKTEHGL